MANDRIYLRCKRCGEAMFLGKTFGDGYYWSQYKPYTLQETLNGFYDKHFICVYPSEDDMGENVFEIVYENDDDFCEKVSGFYEYDEAR